MDWTIIKDIGGVLMGAAALFVALRGERNRRADARKTDAETAGVMSDAAIKLIEPLRTRIEELERSSKAQLAEIASLRKQINERDTLIIDLQQKQARQEDGIRRLAAQVVSLGGQPVYQLPDAEARG